MFATSSVVEIDNKANGARFKLILPTPHQLLVHGLRGS